MWANLNLLFWLSLVPFATKWMGQTNFEKFPVIIYALLALFSGVSYNILSQTIYRSLSEDDKLKSVLKFDLKSFLSIVFYATAIPAALFDTHISLALFLAVSIMWLIPSKRIETELMDEK
jgi:uncharacterized membrane protein